jgi:hypothetical protein
VARLLVMRRLTVEGFAPADAARAAIETPADELDEAVAAHGRSAPAREADAEAPAEPGQRSGRAHLRALPGGGEGARGVSATSQPGAHPSTIAARVGAVIDAALAYDLVGCIEQLRLGVQGDPAAWWSQLVEPAWLRLAQRTVLGSPGEVPELVLATAALRALRDFTQAFEQAQVGAGNPPQNHPSRMRKIVLIFAAPDELVPLAAHALAASLVAHGAAARIVTGPASTHRAVELVTMVRPAAVVLATTLAHPDVGVVGAVHEAFEDMPIFVSLRNGDRVGDLPLATTVQRVRSFPGLLHEILAVVR